jgi:hypothetical protein
MNYPIIYNNLIKRAQHRDKPNCYVESHHIIPKALGGSNNRDNLVYLTAREHCLAHLLLAKIHGGKMWHAVNGMTNFHKMTSRAYSIAKEKSSENMRGDKNPRYGKPLSEKQILAIKTANSKPYSKERILARTGSKNPNFKGYTIATNIVTGVKLKFCGDKELKAAGFTPSNVNACVNKKPKYLTHKGHTFHREN